MSEQTWLMRFVCGESSVTSYTQKSQTYMIHRAESTSPGMVVLETNAYKEMRSRRFGGRGGGRGGGIKCFSGGTEGGGG